MWFVSEEDEQRFGHALLASLLLHVLVLGYVKGVEPLRKPGNGGALTVNLRFSAVVDEKQGVVTSPPVPTPALPSTTPTISQAKTVVSPRPASKPQPPTAASRVDAPQRVPSPENAAESSVRGARAASNRGPRGIVVLLEIGADGHPQAIHWDKLPALTRPQFEQLEAIIRRQVYASTPGARLTQEIDVLGLLGIRSSSAPPAPRPTVESVPTP